MIFGNRASKVGDRRIKRRFAWLPQTMTGGSAAGEGMVVWLEFYKTEELLIETVTGQAGPFRFTRKYWRFERADIPEFWDLRGSM